jgi:predicted dehydrogenase
MTRPRLQSEPLRVAIVGAGMISHHHLIAWRNASDAARVTAVFDPNPARAGARAQEFGISTVYRNADALLADEAIDALDIASPCGTHAFWIEAAAVRGIDALCQKPLTPTLAQAKTLIAGTADRMRLMVHENWRFRPWYRELKKWLNAGELGEIIGIQMTVISSGLLPDKNGDRPALVRQPFMANEPRLMIGESLIHQLDVVRWLAGPLRVVSARALHTLPEVKGETLATILLESTVGAPIVVSGTMAAPGFPPRNRDRLEVLGRRASATLEGSDLRLLGSEPRHVTYDFNAGYQASFDGVIAHFVERLRSGAPFETDPVDNLETLYLVEHAYWAAGLREVGKGA